MATQFAIDAANLHTVVQCDVTQLPGPTPWPGLIQFYHYTYWLFNVFVTCPVTVASCERPFSTIRRLKTWVSNSMGEERLSHDEHSPRHSPECQWHYWSLHPQELKNSIYFVHVSSRYTAGLNSLTSAILASYSPSYSPYDVTYDVIGNPHYSASYPWTLKGS